MKTVQSFFPTTTKSKASFRKDNTYKVMKKVQDQGQNLQIQQIKPKSKFSQQVQSSSPQNQNIFRDKNNTVKNYSLDQNIQRPIGGADLFRKMEKLNQSNIEESTRRLSRKGSRKNIKQSRQKLMPNQSKSHHHVNLLAQDKIQEQFKQQTFKQHTDCKQKYTVHSGNKIYGSRSLGKYHSQPNSLTQNSRKCTTSQQKYGRNDRKHSAQSGEKLKVLTQQSCKSSSVQSLCRTSQQQNNIVRWASQQQRNYLDKMAILNQINYNRPLIQKLGSKYFQCFLRNRYLDEPQFNHKSPFIYQIKEKLANTKFISKIKSMKPANFLQRNKIVIKGRNKLAKQQQDRMDNKDIKKRWQEWNQESFQM